MSLVSSGLNADAWTRGRCGPEDQPTKWAQLVNASVQPLPEHPRPQLVRGDSSWQNLNGLWEWQLEDGPLTSPVFGSNLSGSILVPFAPESCLSGIGAFNNWPTPPPSFEYTLYRAVFDADLETPTGGVVTLHFGAVDWNASVWLNGEFLGAHIGGYSAFSFDATKSLKRLANELFVFAHDPSDSGPQPAGKQRVSTIVAPGGDHYTPTSGVWQTVWLEATPQDFVTRIDYETAADLSSVRINVTTAVDPISDLAVSISFQGVTVATLDGASGKPFSVALPAPRALWTPAQPSLYDINITLKSTGDSVTSYFGLRTVSKGARPTKGSMQYGVDRPGGDLPGSPFTLPAADPSLCAAACAAAGSGCAIWAYAVPNCHQGTVWPSPTCWLKGSNAEPAKPQSCRVSGGASIDVIRPLLNNNFTFLAGWLDQSWFPDSLYTAPTDEALAFDVSAVKTFGFNMVRLHQKVNPQRWYYYADKLGVALQQDAVQKFGAGQDSTSAWFASDLKNMVDDLRAHPSVIAWTIFNEHDCVGDSGMDPAALVSWLSAYDSTRLIDTNSGGPANNLYIGDFDDLHSYPYPSKAFNAANDSAQLRSFGEFGGIGAFVDGKEWVTGKCHTYLPAPLPEDEAAVYVNMTQQLAARRDYDGLSISIYTQIVDVELECDGFLNYDRTDKFDAETHAKIVAANEALIGNM